jgi:hypothetical protein
MLDTFSTLYQMLLSDSNCEAIYVFKRVPKSDFWNYCRNVAWRISNDPQVERMNLDQALIAIFRILKPGSKYIFGLYIQDDIKVLLAQDAQEQP